MGAKENILKLIDKKQAEIRELEGKVREATAYIQALQDSIKVLPRDVSEEQPELRASSALAKTKELIENSGKPLHISEILKLLGRPADKKNRVSLSGTLSSYARTGRIFKKTAPNTFGLIKQNNGNSYSGSDDEADSEPLAKFPASFGKL